MRRTFVLLVILGLALACGGPGVGDPDPPTEAWRSALYPEDWTPAFTDGEGRFLPDVSYAGYRNGEAALPINADRPTVDVVSDFGADPTGATDTTAAIQSALDSGEDRTVFFPEGTYRVDGLLTVTRPGVVLRGRGFGASRLVFTRHEGLTGRDHLTFRGALETGASYPLVEDAQPRAFVVKVADASGLVPGMDVQLGWTITAAFIAEHGMIDTWRAFNGTWQVFLRREVVAVDTSATPHEVRLDAPIRYVGRVRDGASLKTVTGHLTEVGMFGIAVGTAVSWDEAWANERTHAIGFHGVKDAWIHSVESFAPPQAPSSGPGAGDHLQNGGIFVKTSKRVTVSHCRMKRAQHRGGGGCGYLFEILQSCEVLTEYCEAEAGRHNFIQNWGFGTTGCVWSQCVTRDGFAISLKEFPTIGQLGFSEYHHSLATANVVDRCYVHDGWAAQNRHDWSTGAGHTATGCVFWNALGRGILRSYQFGTGYVIGTEYGLTVETALGPSGAEGTEPEDWREGIGDGLALEPPSLYVDQFRRRVGRDPATAP